MVSFVILTIVFTVLDRLFPFDLSSGEKDSSILVVAHDSTPLRAFADKNGIWRYPISLETVSPLYIQALLKYEDRFFRFHPGVNPFALFRAVWQWLNHGKIVSGGSTITMQVVRFIEPQPRSFAGKICQIFRALQLEIRNSKNNILTFYINHAPFGGTLEGVQAASFSYLGKPANELSHAEAAFLAVLPQAPTRFRPDRHPEKAQQARNKVLRRMAHLGVWPDKIIERAYMESVSTKTYNSPMYAPLLAFRLKNQIPPGTFRPSSIDFNLQRMLEQRLSVFASELPEHTSAALVIVENQNLAVRAYAGSVDFFDLDRFGHVDMVRAIRSPGSALKPFLYGFALEDGLIHSQSLLNDVPISFSGYQPANFTGGYSGPVSVTEALQRSLNIPAVQVLEQVKPDVFATRLQQGGLHLALPRYASPNLSLVLGGAGTNLESLTAAYTCFARKGLSGRLRFFEDEPLINRYMMSESAAWIVRDILKNNPRPGINMERFRIPEHRKIAWKTGTSYGFRDTWAIGLNNTYTVGVWIGRPDGTPIPGHYGIITAAPILFSIFDFLTVENKNRFFRPSDVYKADICWPLGVEFNPEKPGLCHIKKTAWVINGMIPPTFADRNRKIWQPATVKLMVNPENDKQVKSDCRVSLQVEKEIPLWPLMLEPWLSSEIRYKAALPLMDPACISQTPYSPGIIKIMGASSGTVLRRPKGSANFPKLDLSVIGAAQDVFWLINGEIKQKTGSKKAFTCQLDDPGPYEITAMDIHGNFDTIHIHVLQ